MGTYPHDRELEPGEVARTAILFVVEGPTQAQCPCCKNRDVHRLVGAWARPFERFHQFDCCAFSCHCCGAVWSFLSSEGRRQSQIKEALNFRIPFV